MRRPSLTGLSWLFVLCTNIPSIAQNLQSIGKGVTRAASKLRIEQIKLIEERIGDLYFELRRQAELDLEVVERRLIAGLGRQQLALCVVEGLSGQIDLEAVDPSCVV